MKSRLLQIAVASLVAAAHLAPGAWASTPMPSVTYTCGKDLSGSLGDAGGIGGLLARTDSRLSTPNSPNSTVHYHSDGNGNVTALINAAQQLAAKHEYDPFGNTISTSGSLAEANHWQFSSKEIEEHGKLSCYGYRFYCPSLQRWATRDPYGEPGFEIVRRGWADATGDDSDAYLFVGNDPVSSVDLLGLKLWKCTRETKWGFGQHVYLWDDTSRTSCGRGGGNPFKGRGVDNPGDRGPGTDGHTCTEINNSSGKEATVMACCRKPRTHIFIPLGHDCHNWFDNCLGSSGLPDPQIYGRFYSPSDVFLDYKRVTFTGGPWPGNR